MSACLKKRAYRTAASASAVARRRSTATGLALVHYACAVGHWHVGHRGARE